MTAANEFPLPDLGEGLTEAEIVSWSVSVGDEVEVDQPLCEVETAKAIVELPSPFAGTVAALHAGPGETVAVGAPLITIGSADAGDPPGGPGPSPGDQPRSAHATRPVDETDPADGADAATDPRDGPPRDPHTEDSAGSTPATLVGSGPSPHRPPHRAWRRRTASRAGRETGADPGPPPNRAAEQAPNRAADPVADATSDRDLRRSAGIRRSAADAVARSAREIPHATALRNVDMTASTDLLARLRDDPDYRGARVTPLTAVANAALVALRRHPTVNSLWDAETGTAEERRGVDLGIAVAGPDGLIVPHIRAADRLGLRGLSDALTDLVDRARAGRATVDELAHGTFSITNVGVFGLDAGTAIINPGESAILSLGSVAPRPWADRGELVVRDTATLGLSFDHRVIDGRLAGSFLAAVAAVLTNPLRLAD